MIALIFCDINIELIALTGALATALVVSATWIGAVLGLVGDAILTGGQVFSVVGAGIAAVPAALAILLALGLTLPVTLK